MKKEDEILNYIEKLMNNSFDSWDRNSIQGYKTALISLRKYIRNMEKINKTVDNKLYEVWYSEFNKAYLLVRNNLTIIDAGEKEDMIRIFNAL